MTSIKGLFAIGECNFSDHGANRLGASALMQGLADGYFVLDVYKRQVDNFLHKNADVAEAIQQKIQESEKRSEEHTSELQSLRRISYAVFYIQGCLKQVEFFVFINYFLGESVGI